LMISLENGSDSLSPLQDWQALYLGAQGNDSQFGGQLSSVSKGMFFDTTYSYSFNIPLQFQSMVDGVEIDNSFRLQLYDAKRNPKVAKLWSNLFTNPKRIRLEVVYIKL